MVGILGRGVKTIIYNENVLQGFIICKLQNEERFLKKTMKMFTHD